MVIFFSKMVVKQKKKVTTHKYKLRDINNSTFNTLNHNRNSQKSANEKILSVILRRM